MRKSKLAVAVLAGVVASGCATTYDLCLPSAEGTCLAQKIKTYRRIKNVEATYSVTDGLKVKLEGVSGSPVEDATADLIRGLQAGSGG